ncbi:MAG: hypothetical protein JWN16_2235 [Alphaproteobacteria bacterium]|nr:hypothetical protein [Alphaproteobacteria bacterium]
MVIRALDVVPDCYSWENGNTISKTIGALFQTGQTAIISFDDVTDVPSSFVNAAFISLLDEYTFEFIKSHLKLINCSSQIIDMVQRRFEFETRSLKAS